MNVSRLSQAGRKKITSLRQKKYRDSTGYCLVEGRRAVESAVAAGAGVREIVVTDEVLHDDAMASVLAAAGAVFVASARDIERLSDVETSQGIVAVACTEWSRLEDVEGCRRIVALDGIQDPGNVGTILRSAAWFGIDGVLCGRGVADCYGPKVLRASMGGVWDLRLVRADALATDLSRLHAKGHVVYAADLRGEDMESWDPRSPSCLVLGSEAHGVSPEVDAVVDERVRIPGRRKTGATESLNVAVAAGILLSRWT
ncbi:MAG: RNA methyltransferase [Rhodothermales bacterium]|nr:RNA methyltransferase [Rhodothermales bacterium]